VEHRTEVAEAVDRVGGGAADREAVASEAEVASQGRIDAALGAAVRHQHQNVRLPAQEALLERVARSGHVQVHKGVEPRVQAAGEIHLKVAACDLAREGDVAAAVDRRVVIDSGEGEAGHERSGCQTAEDARDPEAYAAFIGPGELGAAVTLLRTTTKAKARPKLGCPPAGFLFMRPRTQIRRSRKCMRAFRCT